MDKRLTIMLNNDASWSICATKRSDPLKHNQIAVCDTWEQVEATVMNFLRNEGLPRKPDTMGLEIDALAKDYARNFPQQS